MECEKNDLDSFGKSVWGNKTAHYLSAGEIAVYDWK